MSLTSKPPISIILHAIFPFYPDDLADFISSIPKELCMNSSNLVIDGCWSLKEGEIEQE